MPNRFYNILVPVNFTTKNRWAVSKAIELANSFNCNIHLVHVVSHPLLPFLPIDTTNWLLYDTSADISNASKKLEDLKARYQQHLCGDGKIEISLLQGNPHQQLARYIEQYDMDLVVTGLSKYNFILRILSFIAISILARQTNIPVLAVRSSGLVSHFKKIVLPLSEDVPVQRIKVATMLARSFKSTVYLVSLRNDANAAENILNKGLEVVQSLSTIPVQCFLLEGKNLAKSTLDFSKRINADLIMISNPLREPIAGFFKRLRKKIFSYHSHIPIMTVDKQPAETVSAS